MAHQLSDAEQLTYSTVRIECEIAAGQVATGTAFCFAFKVDDKHTIPVLVTNKHVVSGAKKGRFFFHSSDQNGAPIRGGFFPIQLDNFEQRWVSHPDANIDLCMMPIADVLSTASLQGVRVFQVNLHRSLILGPEELTRLDAIEDVIMVGYPVGLWDQVNNMPIVRKGITATHPSLDYNGRPEFMIDAACFPGSSGSPVFLFNHGSFAVKSGETHIGRRTKLLGILYAGPQHKTTGEIQVVQVPTAQKPISVLQIPINLGVVIKASKLLDFESVFRQLIYRDLARASGEIRV